MPVRTTYVKRLAMMLALCAMFFMPTLAHAEDSGVIQSDHSWQRLQESIDQAGNGSVIKLTEDVRATSGDVGLVVPSKRRVTLDLAGHVLDRGLESPHADGYAIAVFGKLAVIDSSKKKLGKITGGYNAEAGGAIVVEKHGALRLRSGNICKNMSAGDGGAVYVKPGGRFDMSGGDISDNASLGNGGGIGILKGTFALEGGIIRGNVSAGDGGAIEAAKGNIELRGGAISGNTAGKYGGGVYASGSAIAMSDADISGNAALLGGGLYANRGSFEMRGGSISGNVVEERGGGVYIRNCAVKLSGSPMVADNRSRLSGIESPNNVFMGRRDVFDIAGTLSEGARVGVNGACHVFTSGLGSAGNMDAFFSDSGLFVVERSQDAGEAQLSLRVDGGEVSEIQPWTEPFDRIAYSWLSDAPYLPANTEALFELCCSGDWGFDTLKADLRVTSDNGIVLCHDDGFTLNENGRIVGFDPSDNIKIHDMTFQQCMALQYENEYNGSHINVCDFETFIRICSANHRAALITIRDEYIPELAEAMLPILYSYGMQSSCIVNSFELESLKTVKQRDASIRLSWVIRNGELTKGMVDEAAALGNCALTLYSLMVRDGGLQSLALYEYEIVYAQSRGVPLYAAIVGEVSDVDSLKRLGFCGAQFIVGVPPAQM